MTLPSPRPPARPAGPELLVLARFARALARVGVPVGVRGGAGSRGGISSRDVGSRIRVVKR